VDVIHPGQANVSKADVAKKLAEQYGCAVDTVFTFGYATAFGGGRASRYFSISPFWILDSGQSQTSIFLGGAALLSLLGMLPPFS
jgi:hypothetical protein